MFSQRRIWMPAGRRRTIGWWTPGRPDTLCCDWSAGKTDTQQPIRWENNLPAAGQLPIKGFGFVSNCYENNNWLKCSSLKVDVNQTEAKRFLLKFWFSPLWPWGTCSSLLCWLLQRKDPPCSSELGNLNTQTIYSCLIIGYVNNLVLSRLWQ